jgi:hypothetical protein
MVAAVDCEAPGAFYSADEGGEIYRGGGMADGEWSSSMLPLWREERKGQCLFRK